MLRRPTWTRPTWTRPAWTRPRAAGDRRASVALEFSLIAPFLTVAVLGVYDCRNIFLASANVAFASQQIVQIASNLALTNAPKQDGSSVMTVNAAAQSMSAVFGVFPEWKTSKAQIFSVTLSSVRFAQSDPTCRSDCKYDGYTAWSTAFHQDAAHALVWDQNSMPPELIYQRPCTKLAPVDPPQTVSLQTLPSPLYAPNGILVADVTYIYKPLFLYFITGPVVISRSAYSPLRAGATGQYATFSPTTDLHICPAI